MCISVVRCVAVAVAVALAVVCCVVCCDTSKRFTVTPVLYSRVFEILSALTFGALRKKKLCQQRSRPPQKKRKKNNETSSSTCGQPRIMIRQEHNRSKKGTVAWEKIKMRRPCG